MRSAQPPVGLAPPTDDAREFHRRVAAGAASPLVEAPAIAERLGVDRVYVKDESARLGTYAFKVLGASWAIYRSLCERAGAPPADWQGWNDLAAHFAPLGPLQFVAATDGNHGHAVAYVAALLGFRARIYLPAAAQEARLARLRPTGAEIVLVDGNYDETVARAARDATDGELLISDTGWPGYEQVPTWIGDGYETILAETDEQLPEPLGDADLVAVQIGVGALAGATVRHYRHLPGGPTMVGVEALTSACVMASLAAGYATKVPGDHKTAMDGLAAGEPSTVTLPTLQQGMDVLVAAGDGHAQEAAAMMADSDVLASPTGAGGLAGLLGLLDAGATTLAGRRSVLLINTEAPL